MALEQILKAADNVQRVPSESEIGLTEADLTACHDSGQVDVNHTQEHCSRDSECALPPGYTYRESWLEFQSEKSTAIRVCCSSFRVIAWYGTAKLDSHGLVLEFDHLRGLGNKRFYLQLSQLEGDPRETLRALVDEGLQIAVGRDARKRLCEFLQQVKPKIHLILIGQVGWFKISGGGYCFVLPGEILCSQKSTSPVQVELDPEAITIPTDCKEGFEIWRDQVSVLAEGNSRLVMAICSAFLGPLLGLLDLDPFGIHFMGATSKGKTTALRMASSVWGPPERMQTLRATSKGLEGIAVAHNDTSATFDELGQMDPTHLEGLAYMLSGKRGTQRAKQDGSARAVKTFCFTWLSSGELSVEEHLRSKGIRYRGGQQVRWIELLADLGPEGIFEETHGRTPKQLAEEIKAECSRSYGTVGRLFLRILFLIKLTDEDPETDTLEPVKVLFQRLMKDYEEDLIIEGSSGEVQRVMRNFAALAVVGELAALWKLVAWSPGHALQMAQKAFGDWTTSRGGVGAMDHERILDHVRRFFEEFGPSRFVPEVSADSLYYKPPLHRAGFRLKSGEYAVLTKIFTGEICKGYSRDQVVKALLEEGLLVPDPNTGNPYQTKRIEGKPCKVYVFSSKIDDGGVAEV